MNSLNLVPDVQHNIWAMTKYPKINRCMVALDFVEITLDKESKRLLQIQRKKFIPMTNWSLILQQAIEWDKCIKAFKVNIQGCKINKL